MFKNDFLKIKGFTLVETLVGMALFSGLVLAGMRLMGNLGDTKRGVQTDTDELALTREIKSILSSERFCRVSLTGDGPPGSPDTPLTFNKSNIDEPGEGIDVELYYSNAAGDARSSKRYSASDSNNNRLGKLTLTSIKFLMDNEVIGDYGPAPEHFDIGHIRVTYTYLTSKNVLTTGNLAFPIFVKMSTSAGGLSTFISCSDRESNLKGIAAGPPNDYDVIGEEVCNRLHNYNWDPGDKICYPSHLSNYNRIIGFKLKYTAVGWSTPTHRVIHSNFKDD